MVKSNQTVILATKQESSYQTIVSEHGVKAMGLGFLANIPYGVFKEKRKAKVKQYFEQLTSPVPEYSVILPQLEDGFEVSLVPYEENIHVTFAADTLQISARSNSAGPGYHAFLIEMLDGLFREIGVKPDSAEVEDETEYFFHRDFEQLQKSMASLLSSVATTLVEAAQGQEKANYAISMSLDCFPDDNTHFACSSLGFWDKSYFDQIKSSDCDLSAFGEFFIWWNKAQDASFYKKSALAIIWVDLNWLPPVNEESTARYRSALTCLEKAYSLNPHDEYPIAEWLEIANLIQDENLSAMLATRFLGAQGIDTPTLGFCRGNLRSLLPGGFHLTHPGKMYFEHDDSMVWWDGERTIHARVFTVTPKEGVESSNEALLDSGTNSADFEPFLKLKNREVAAKIQHSETEENGKPLFVTELRAAYNNNLLILLIFYEAEQDKDWAIEICASVGP